MADDIETYRFQLTTIEETLAKDPDNAELLELKRSVEEVIALLTAAQGGSSNGAASAAAHPSASSATSAKHNHPKGPAHHHQHHEAAGSSGSYAKGQTVMAKYSGDGQFYEAVVDEIQDEDADAPIYVVTFSGYGNQEVLAGDDLRPAPGAAAAVKKKAAAAPLTVADTPFAQASAAAAAASQQKKRSAGVFETEDFQPSTKVVVGGGGGATDGDKKKKAKKDGPSEKQQEKKQLMERVNGWKQFAGKKSGVVNKQSIFATADDPNYRVGVTGSGKPMTQFTQRTKKT